MRVPYTYLDVDLDLDALRESLAIYPGPRRTPIVTVGGQVLAEPDNDTVLASLTAAGVLPSSTAVARAKDLNMGDLDRLTRGLAAVLMASSAGQAPIWLRWPLRFGSIVLALTAARGWCPLYDACGMTSIGGPGDRPDEAERPTWLHSTTPHTARSLQ